MPSLVKHAAVAAITCFIGLKMWGCARESFAQNKDDATQTAKTVVLTDIPDGYQVDSTKQATINYVSPKRQIGE